MAFWQRLRAHNPGRDPKGSRHSYRPLLETLEDRLTPTSLLSVAGSPTLITDADAPGTFSLRIVFDGTMNTNVAPTITFPTAGENPGASLSLSGIQASGDHTFIATFTATDQNVSIPNIDVQVSGARDFNNVLVPTQTVANVFSIDTQTPAVTGFAVNKPHIITSDVGTNLVVQVAYHDPMQTAINPTITFSQNASSALTPLSGVWNGSGTIFTATYRIHGLNIVIPAINISVTGAQNLAGFTQLDFLAEHALSIDTSSNSTASFPVGSSVRLTGDFNGDGLSDVAAWYASNSRWLVSLSTGTSFLAPKRWFIFNAVGGFGNFQVGDFNNDGKDDIAYFYNPSGVARWGMLQSNGSAFTAAAWSNLAAFGTTGWVRHVVGDFNNDGLPDIASFQKTTTIARWVVGLSTGSSFTISRWTSLASIAVNGWTKAIAGDFNGDGKTDIANFLNINGIARWWVSLSNGTSFTNANFGNMPTAGTWTSQMAGDFNNDGNADLVSFNSATNKWFVSLSNATGTAFNTTQWLALTPFGRTSQVVGDFDQDGKTDLSVLDLGSGQVAVGLSTGTNFAASLWETLPATPLSFMNELVGDFDGDGRPDLALFLGNSSMTQWWVSINNLGSFSNSIWR